MFKCGITSEMFRELYLSLSHHLEGKVFASLPLTEVGAMLGGSLVTTAGHVLSLRMEGGPSAVESSWEYIE
jgi:hypothetical protein